MSNSPIFKFFYKNLSEDDKLKYQEMSAIQRKNWFILYLENELITCTCNKNRWNSLVHKTTNSEESK
jgi:uncharacterized membrane protein YkgB